MKSNEQLIDELLERAIDVCIKSVTHAGNNIITEQIKFNDLKREVLSRMKHVTQSNFINERSKYLENKH